MIIECTDEQAKKMAAAAINSSSPVGMGFLHHDPNLHVKPEEIEIRSHSIYIDYFKGRMVKFHARKVDDNSWEFADEIRSDYQSWIMNYDGYQELFNAVAGE